MTRFFLDTNVFVYATGAQHAYREPCRAIIARLDAVRAEIPSSVLGEVAHERLRQTGSRTLAARDVRHVAALVQVHDVARDHVLAAMQLYADAEALDAADAILAAVALARGVEVVVSTDRAFDEVHGLRRVDPLQDGAVQTLLGGERKRPELARSRSSPGEPRALRPIASYASTRGAGPGEAAA